MEIRDLLLEKIKEAAPKDVPPLLRALRELELPAPAILDRLVALERRVNDLLAFTPNERKGYR